MFEPFTDPTFLHGSTQTLLPCLQSYIFWPNTKLTKKKKSGKRNVSQNHVPKLLLDRANPNNHYITTVSTLRQLICKQPGSQASESWDSLICNNRLKSQWITGLKSSGLGVISLDLRHALITCVVGRRRVFSLALGVIWPRSARLSSARLSGESEPLCLIGCDTPERSTSTGVTSGGSGIVHSFGVAVRASDLTRVYRVQTKAQSILTDSQFKRVHVASGYKTPTWRTKRSKNSSVLAIWRRPRMKKQK